METQKLKDSGRFAQDISYLTEQTQEAQHDLLQMANKTDIIMKQVEDAQKDVDRMSMDHHKLKAESAQMRAKLESVKEIRAQMDDIVKRMKDESDRAKAFLSELETALK
ncbi:hypothetical protein MP638_004807 [Amoeboaphelidium occidentale]|nr:hypothetical protein MP638_004807 [Amoeboaphelidium occidentale]